LAFNKNEKITTKRKKKRKKERKKEKGKAKLVCLQTR